MSYIFGKTVFCDGSNLSASRAFINSELTRRGYARPQAGEATTCLKFNSADAPDVINIVYDFLRKVECDEQNLDHLSARARALSGENERLQAEKSRFEARLKASEREADGLRSALQQGKSALATAQADARQLRDSLNKSTTAMAHIKTQVSHDLRKRDVQLGRLRDQLFEGGSARRGRVVSGLSTSSASLGHRKVSSGQCTDTIARDQEPPYDPNAELALRVEADALLGEQLQEVIAENDALSELLQATLASLDTLVSIDSVSDETMFASVARSVIVLEAQLRVRLTAVKEILEMPGYVPVDEVQVRDDKIATLTERLVEVEAQWSAAQHVLRGLTASVLDTAGPRVKVPATGASLPAGLADADADASDMADHLVPLRDSDDNPVKPVLQSLDANRVFARSPYPADIKTVISPMHVGAQNGLCKADSSISIDARLLRASQPMANPDVTSDSSVALRRRAGEKTTSRKGRRMTIGLFDPDAAEVLDG